MIEILVAGICFLNSGCVSRVASMEKRNASFSPYIDTKIGNIAATSFLGLRHAIVISGSHSFGSAVAVDQRGYFLTAAHCVSDSPLELMVASWQPGNSDITFESRTCRIVWRGNEQNNEPDLAILRISSTIEWAFEWAADFKRDDVVLGMGPNYVTKKELEVDLGCFAGKILKVAPVENGKPKYTQIWHDAPMHPGDSGGPITTLDGRLLGINDTYSAMLLLPTLKLAPYTSAIRPDLAWLRQMIEADFVASVPLPVE